MYIFQKNAILLCIITVLNAYIWEQNIQTQLKIYTPLLLGIYRSNKK